MKMMLTNQNKDTDIFTLQLDLGYQPNWSQITLSMICLEYREDATSKFRYGKLC